MRFRWPGLSSDVAAHRFDVAADGITVRPERSVLGVFTVPIARGGAVLLVRRPSWARAVDVASLDRPELRVVVNQGGHLERVAKSVFHAAAVQSIPDNAAVREAFVRGDADAVMTNTFEAPRWATGLTGIETVGPLTTDDTALWLAADHADLATQLDAWLLAEEASGRLGALRAKWQVPSEPTARPIDALFAATAERLALMPFVAAAKRSAGAGVDDPAQEQRVLDAAWAAAGKPVDRVRVDAFFRAQIEAAKEIQRTAPPVAPTFSLADLRAAIARITARMAFLFARVGPHGDVRARAERDLPPTGLSPEMIDRIVATLR